MIDTTELEEYTILANDDISEVCESLAHLATREYCLSDEFYKALEIEVARQTKEYKENWVITETMETKTVTSKKISLDYIG